MFRSGSSFISDIDSLTGLFMFVFKLDGKLSAISKS